MTSRYQNIFQTVAFLAIIILVTYLVNEFYCDQVLKKQQIFRHEEAFQKYLSDNKTRIVKYAFFGDSHPEAAVDPEVIPDSYNFSLIGENYIQIYLRFKKIVEQDGLKIDTALFEVDPHIFNFGIKNSDRLSAPYYYSQFVPYSQIAEIRNESVFKVWLRANFPVFGAGEDFWTIFIVKPEPSPIKLGWQPLTGDFSQNNRVKVAIAKYRDHFENKNTFDPIMLKYFLETLAYAKEKNMKIYLVLYPLSQEYQDQLKNHEFNSGDYYKKVLGLVNERIGHNFTVLNYKDLFVGHPDNFSDSDHLNFKGAEILSRKIFKDLIFQ